MSRRAQKSQKIPNEQQHDNERQFRCKCSKIYKSYPALYTHIKNKHPNNMEEYKIESKRPKEYEIDKGRPKKLRARPMQADEQGDLLNIIELGILEIEVVLKGKIYNEDGSQKFETLTGNRRLQFEELKGHYMLQKQHIVQKLREYYGYQKGNVIIEELNGRDLSSLRNEIPVKVYKEEIRFRHELVQHFNAITAAKILVQLELLEIQQDKTMVINQSQGLTLNDNDIDNRISFNTDRKSIISLCEESLWGQQHQKNIIAKTIETIRNNWSQKLNKISNQSYINDHDSQSSQQSPQEKEGSEQKKQSSSQSVHELPQVEQQSAQFMECIN